MARTLHCEILSPEGNVFTGEATLVVATAVDGEFGLLYNHAPLIAALGKGRLRLQLEGGGEKVWKAEGGFLEVAQNKVTVLTDRIEAK